MKQRAEKYLEIALGGNMNIASLKPLALIEIMTDFAKKEVEAINYTHCCTTFTCDVCYKETSNKKDNEGYRYCKSCKEL